MKHFLKLQDLSPNEIEGLIESGIELKAKRKNGMPHKLLQGKSLGMIFTKASTRTRVSFEVGMYELGGQALFMNQNDLQINRGEPIEDTARVLSRYLDGIMIRTYKQSDVEALAANGTASVMNGLTDYCHPTQIIADLITFKEYKGDFKGKKIAYIGDGNNVANSLIVGAVKLGMEVAVISPPGFYPDKHITEWAHLYGNLYVGSDFKKGLLGADAVYTDVWASMGQEHEAELRKKAFKGFMINDETLKLTENNPIVLHCLPAHKGEEISHSVFDAHASEIFDEAENRLHAHKAIMVACMGG